MEKCELYWLAGLLEGEGSFYPGPPSSPNLPILSVSMTDEDVIAKVASLLGVTYNLQKSRHEKWKESYCAKVKGRTAVELMKKLKPLMGERRQSQIDKALISYDGKYSKLNEERVLQIKRDLSSGLTQKAVGLKHGVSRETVNKIKNEKIWKEVTV